MPLRTSNSVEKNVYSIPLLPLDIPANTSTVVLDSIHGVSGEFAGRYVFNAGANPAYYAYGHQVDSTNFEGVIVAGQQFDASNCGQSLNVYSVLGTTFSRTLLKRNDLTQPNRNIL